MRLLAFVCVALAVGAGCGGDDDPAGPGTDGGGGGTDSGPATDGGGPGTDGSMPGTDSGPLRIDAGPCGPDPTLERGAPIDAPDGEWTFIDFPDSRCMNDTPTGIGIRPSATSNNVMIYMEGGGACFDFVSCFGVAHAGGFDAGDMASLAASSGDQGIFNRADPDNPVAEWNMVFIPYCTGDVHAGNNPDGFGGRTQVGYANVGEYLERLVPTFEGADQVLLTGSSAGGFGAAYNFDRVQRAFGCTPVTLLDDAGPPMADTYMKPCLQQWWRELWNLNDTLPADCTACTNDDGGGMVNFSAYLAAKYPDRRFGLLSTMEDSVIRTFFGYGYSPSCRSPDNMRAADFRAGLLDLRENVLGPYPRFLTFFAEGDSHTFLGRPLSDVTVGGTTLAAWIRQLVEADPAWSSVGP